MNVINQKKNRSTILLLSDHLEKWTGVGNIARGIIEETCYQFNWIQLGGNTGKKVPCKRSDYSQIFDQNVEEADPPRVWAYPVAAYGSQSHVRQLLDRHDIDGVLIFGDPRQYHWLFAMDSEISVPIMFYHVWDNLPVPKFNKKFYDCCTGIACISKLTYGVVNSLYDGITSYVPHGRPESVFYPITQDLNRVQDGKNDWDKLQEMKEKHYGDEDPIVIMWNNKNMFRKQVGLVINTLAKVDEKINNARDLNVSVILRTDPSDASGMDFLTYLSDNLPHLDIRVMPKKVSAPELNLYYNLADYTINLASMEGFGLTTLESLLAGTPIIVNSTGGLQDQCGYKRSGEDVSAEDYIDVGRISNRNQYEVGEWAVVVSPAVSTIIGSQDQPYMYEDRVSMKDAANIITEHILYTPKDKRIKGGLKGRSWAISQGMTNSVMGDRMVEFIDEVLTNYDQTEDRWKLTKIR